jgi:hypothetical protein
MAADGIGGKRFRAKPFRQLPVHELTEAPRRSQLSRSANKIYDSTPRRSVWAALEKTQASTSELLKPRRLRDLSRPRRRVTGCLIGRPRRLGQA